MSRKPDGTVRNSSGGIDGYTNDYGMFVWGNPDVVAEHARRQDMADIVAVRDQASRLAYERSVETNRLQEVLVRREERTAIPQKDHGRER